MGRYTGSKKPSKKPLIFYYVLILAALVLFNATLFPNMMQRQVQSVSYDVFMSMTYDRNVDQVQIEGDEITFTDREQNIYQTNVTEEPGRTERLYECGARFTEIDTQPGLLSRDPDQAGPEGD